MKLTIEIDTDEVAAKMLESGAGGYMFSGEFWDVMAELYPDLMTEVYEELTRLTNAVQAVADADRDEVLKRAWFTAKELNKRFGGSKV